MTNGQYDGFEASCRTPLRQASILKELELASRRAKTTNSFCQTNAPLETSTAQTDTPLFTTSVHNKRVITPDKPRPASPRTPQTRSAVRAAVPPPSPAPLPTPTETTRVVAHPVSQASPTPPGPPPAAVAPPSPVVSVLAPPDPRPTRTRRTVTVTDYSTLDLDKTPELARLRHAGLPSASVAHVEAVLDLLHIQYTARLDRMRADLELEQHDRARRRQSSVRHIFHAIDTRRESDAVSLAREMEAVAQAIDTANERAEDARRAAGRVEGRVGAGRERREGMVDRGVGATPTPPRVEAVGVQTREVWARDQGTATEAGRVGGDVMGSGVGRTRDRSQRTRGQSSHRPGLPSPSPTPAAVTRSIASNVGSGRVAGYDAALGLSQGDRGDGQVNPGLSLSIGDEDITMEVDDAPPRSFRVTRAGMGVSES